MFFPLGLFGGLICSDGFKGCNRFYGYGLGLFKKLGLGFFKKSRILQEMGFRVLQESLRDDSKVIWEAFFWGKLPPPPSGREFT